MKNVTFSESGHSLTFMTFLFTELNNMLSGIALSLVKGHEPKSYETLGVMLDFS